MLKMCVMNVESLMKDFMNKDESTTTCAIEWWISCEWYDKVGDAKGVVVDHEICMGPTRNWMFGISI